MTQRKKSAYRDPGGERGSRAGVPAARDRREPLPRQDRYRPGPDGRHSGSARRRDDASRRMVSLAILGLGLMVALGVMMASFSGGSGGTTGPSAKPSAAEAAQLETTIANLTERLRLNPSDLGALIALGNAYYDAGRWTESTPWYEKALEAAPTNTDVRTDLGTAYYYAGNLAKAKEHWFKVLEQDPNKVQTHYNLAILYSHSEPPDMEAAAREWETVIKVAPSSEQAKQAEQNLKKIGKR